LANKDLLMAKINESGYKIGYIADCIGISRQTLSYRLNNHSDFKDKEAARLKRILNLSNKEVDDIFFAEYVDEITT